MSSPLILIENISKNYVANHRSVAALKQISFTIEEKDIYGIIGPSGAGKSTLIRCLARLITPDSGRILFQGVDISKMGRKELRKYYRRIGMIFQHFNLLSSRSVEENILYPLEIAGLNHDQQQERLKQLLELVDLKEKRKNYPSQLSGGEKQRVGIARALALNPILLLCDEATSALDPKSTREILLLLKEIHHSLGVTIVLITHDMEVIKRICNKIAIIEQGKIVEIGSTLNIFSTPKQPTTKSLLQNYFQKIPKELIKPYAPNRKLLRLQVKGNIESEPILSIISQQFHIETNILLAWIGYMQLSSVGTLIVEFKGDPKDIEKTLDYLQRKQIHYEEITEDEH